MNGIRRMIEEGGTIKDGVVNAPLKEVGVGRYEGDMAFLGAPSRALAIPGLNNDLSEQNARYRRDFFSNLLNDTGITEQQYKDSFSGGRGGSGGGGMAFWAALLPALQGVMAGGAASGAASGVAGGAASGGAAGGAAMGGMGMAGGGGFWKQFAGQFGGQGGMQSGMQIGNQTALKKDAAIQNLSETFNPRGPIQLLGHPYQGGPIQMQQNPGNMQLAALLSRIGRGGGVR